MTEFNLGRVVVTALMVAALILVASLAWGQTPDAHGEITLTEPVYRGVRATAPIPPSMHVRNEVGSDGAGLCVISSVIINGQYQGVPGLATPDAKGNAGKGSALWRAAKSRPGGYSPDKLERLVKEVMPREKYASFLDKDPRVLDDLSRRGYPIGATMNTGAQYRYGRIHHMISLIEYRTNGLACVVDNNDPGKFHWMPAKEFDRRWLDGGIGWAWIWTRKPPLLATAGAVVMIASAVVILRRRKRLAVAA